MNNIYAKPVRKEYSTPRTNYTFLYEQFYNNTRLIFAQNLRKKLRTIQAQQKNKVLNFEFKLWVKQQVLH